MTFSCSFATAVFQSMPYKEARMITKSHSTRLSFYKNFKIRRKAISIHNKTICHQPTQQQQLDTFFSDSLLSQKKFLSALLFSSVYDDENFCMHMRGKNIFRFFVKNCPCQKFKRNQYLYLFDFHKIIFFLKLFKV